MSRDEFMDQAGLAALHNPEWRWGQSVFNAAVRFCPTQAEQLRGGEHDCFYVDEKFAAFVNELERLGAFEPEEKP